MKAKFINENIQDVLKPKSKEELDKAYNKLFIERNGVTVKEAQKIVEQLRKLGVDAKLYTKNRYVSNAPIDIIPYKIVDGMNVLLECPTKETAEEIYFSILSNGAFVRKLNVRKSDSSFGNSISIKEAKTLISTLKYKIKVFARGEHVDDNSKYYDINYLEWKHNKRNKNVN